MAVKLTQNDLAALGNPAALAFFERELAAVNQALYVQGDERQIRLLQGQAQFLDATIKQIRAYRANSA